MSLENCIFCKICAKIEPADLLYEDDDMVIFKDIKPASKYHYLAVPKNHIKTAKDLKPEDSQLLLKLIETGKRVLVENGAEVDDLQMGFHWPPFNSISHLHLHLISPASQMGFLSRQIFRPNTWWFASADYVYNNLTNKL
ncbi:PREDICTED: histidine triad nucleotide-binding protein 3-like [Nicrophorus vespilloides]|uniref:Adenosine 5'-monophosphoramidase HINT3 n=1 Tax=Nicrophorus vespilloides TaxID=110193 RepID=A0ABM1MK70_NICVS|nr:PREDICTED: histidine triad nucleotide-binding protein 3-like [Nicrophorus vespilloides]XP_017774971.1 PREDICTED: histidine triad nucleotide-binding protein 3-like [Nicrophorus vespilloides]